MLRNRIEDALVTKKSLLFLFRKLLKRHPIHFWYVCKWFTAALLSGMKRLPWRSRDVDFADQGTGCHFFFYFLGGKSLARVAKVPACSRTPREKGLFKSATFSIPAKEVRKTSSLFLTHLLTLKRRFTPPEWGLETLSAPLPQGSMPNYFSRKYPLASTAAWVVGCLCHC